VKNTPLINSIFYLPPVLPCHQTLVEKPFPLDPVAVVGFSSFHGIFLRFVSMGGFYGKGRRK